MLVDVGIVQAMLSADAEADDLSTLRSSLLGSPRYLAPEQLRNEPLSSATDIYGMALTLCEMLTGKPLIAGRSMYDILMAQMNSSPDLPEFVSETAVGPLLRRALNRDPRIRPNGVELLQSLQELS